MDKQAEFWLKVRYCHLTLAEAANEILISMAPPELGLEINKATAAVQETTFTALKWETRKGASLGDFEIAHKAGNIQDKWQSAYNILKNSNATIKERYHGAGYSYSYWIYNQDKIYRQKLKTQRQKDILGVT